MADINDRAHLMRLVMGNMASQTVRAAVELTVFDALGEHTRSAAEVAAELDLAEQPATRLLRALAGLGLCTEPEAGTFRATPAGELLRTGHEHSVHAFASMFTDPVMTAAWAELPFSVRTGQTAFDEVFGKPFFAQLREEPEKSALFNASMHDGTVAVAETLASHYDFSGFGTALDIGGGDGTLLAPVLREHPNLHGVVFDSAEGGAQAPERLAAAGVGDRASVTAGDFFSAVPGGADVYLIKSILHDWDDDRCVTILRHCRTVIPDDGVLLIIEPVLPELADPALAGLYLSDLNMLVNVGGRERTRAEFVQLCERAGFGLSTAGPIPGTAFWLLEAQPAR
ncbi:methyltransferase [Amycolatopsis suaedae]|uniref:Methyltransferase n=1 Tax=Amycolatopsis suaedae TaxID=2510978 RepID=A0A4Q7IXH6_9PSEU|nr:methyltransferase [Amycolatopsis suaedae]RZQ59651.1 methyltransferase [Amycolatopsis suaedae]